jgi:hypothetical protein
MRIFKGGVADIMLATAVTVTSIFGMMGGMIRGARLAV